MASGMKTKESTLRLEEIIRQVGQYVAFVYEDGIFAGKFITFNDQEVIHVMQKCLKSWRWPEKPSEMSYN